VVLSNVGACDQVVWDNAISHLACHHQGFKVAYYSFIGVQEVYTINVQIYYFFYIDILITNKNPYMRPLLLQITVWEVKGA